MRNILLLVVVFIGNSFFVQSQIINEEIQQLHQKGINFTTIDLFSKNKTTTDFDFSKTISNFTRLTLNQKALQYILQENPKHIRFSLPYNNEKIEVELFQQNILTESFKAENQEGKIFNYNPGKYYRGIIKGEEKSIIALSFFDDDIIGLISTEKHGIINIGKHNSLREYIAFSENDLQKSDSFRCGIEELEEYQKFIQNYGNSQLTTTSNSDIENCIQTRYEITNKTYSYFENTELLLNWMTAIHNQVATLYANEGITISINKIIYWASVSSYNFLSGGMNKLNSFKDNNQDMTEDIGNLIHYENETSYGFIDGLCSENRFSYSAVNIDFNQFPVYSWTVKVIAHEMGHVFGSPHTHDPVWNGNNTRIDDCAHNTMLPPNGGTIMSYCHLTEVGINFNYGFGPQPGDLIRNMISNKSCLGTTCTDDYEENPDFCFNIIKEIVPISYVEFSDLNNSTLNAENPQEIEDFSDMIANVEVGETYKLSVKGYTLPNLFQSTSYITAFFDWNNNGVFEEEETYPIGGFNNSIFGDGLAEMNIEIPTNIPEGDIDMRIVLISHKNPTNYEIPNPCGIFFYGQAEDYTVKIHNELSSSKNKLTALKVYPNPTTNFINIESTQGIKSLKIFNLEGKLLKEINEENDIKQIDFSSFSSGIYLLKVDFENHKTENFRIIKR